MEELKETYRLWWEYARRSQYLYDIYNEFRGTDTNTIKDLMLSLEQTDDKAKLQYAGRLMSFCIFKHFFDLDFDAYWNYEIRQRIKRKSCDGGLLKFEGIKSDMEASVFVFKKLYGKDPTIQEFIDFFPVFITSDIFIYYVRISPYGFTFEAIVEELKEILKPALKAVKSQQSLWRQYAGPTTPVDVDQLRTYLKTYDHFAEGLSVDEVVNKVFPGADKETTQDYDSKVRSVYKFQEKAKRIIKNVEGGLFPGKYKSGPSATPWDSLRVS